MKIFILFLALCFATAAEAQNVKQDKSGNYVALAQTASEAKPTGKTFTDKDGNTAPVYVSAKGKLFVIRTSKKTGNEYRMYLKL